MTVQDVMTKPVITCRPENNLAEATALMWEHDCGALPVVDSDGVVKGIITDRDICIALGTRNVRSADIAVSQVLGEQVLDCRSSDSLPAAMARMSEAKVRRLPVFDEQARLAGILSMDDIVLNAGANGRVGSSVSYRDVVNALQMIYRRTAPIEATVALVRAEDVIAQPISAVATR